MALTSTIYNFDIDLADAGRGVYERLELRVARHPSETQEYLLTRVLAYCLAYEPGISFTKGLSDGKEPAIAVRDLTGALKVWIDIGTPDAARLHRASKASPRVAVYTHRDPARLLRSWSNEKIHRAEDLELYGIDQALLASLAEHLARRMTLALWVSDGDLQVTIGDQSLSGAVTGFFSSQQ